jgi:plasmid stabilization system protein ParE
MNTEQGFTLHPGAAQDITDIWEFILEDNPLAARRVREEILDAVRKLAPFPHHAWVEKQWIIRPRFTAKLFSKQVLLLSDDFGGLMIDWNDLLSVADLVRALPATYSPC